MHVLQNPTQHSTNKGNAQAMSDDTSTHPTFNVPAKIVGWHEEAGARIELLVSIPEIGVRTGQEFIATIRHDPKKLDRNQVTFETHRKKGLLTGGVVVLHKLTLDAPDVVSVKELEVIIDRPRYSQFYLSPDAAISVCPFPQNSMKAKESYVALTEYTVEVRNLEGALSEVEVNLELARSFGQAGLILTGEEADGSAGEFVVVQRGHVSAESICNSLLDNRDLTPELMAHIENKKTPTWYLVPFVKAVLDPDRAGRISSLRHNVDFGDNPKELSWKMSNCIFRADSAAAGAWTLVDATPMTDVLAEPTMLLSLLEERFLK
jgi:hypothetical protein